MAQDTMADISLVWTRTKRYVRLWLRDTASQTFAPLTDTSARLNYIGALVVLFLLFPQWRAEKRWEWFTDSYDSISILVLSFPFFAVLNSIFAIFRVRKNERVLGEWFGARFILHEPKRVVTALVDETDNGKPLVFEVEEAEDNALVSYVIEVDRTDNRAKVELAWPTGQRPIDFSVPKDCRKASFRLPASRKMALLTHLEPESTVTTVRVYMTGWELGKGDGRG